MRISRLSISFSLAVMGFASLSFANLITIPPGLQPGDTYRLAFVTSGFDSRASSNIMDYDTFVSTAATNAGLPGTWQVIGLTAAVNAFAHIGGNFTTPIYGLDGTLIATGSADLWDGNIDSPIVIDEHGNIDVQYNFTGTNADGSASYGPLGNLDITTMGLTSSTNAYWISSDRTASGPTDHAPIYGISGVLTVPGSNDSSVPEPGTVSLMMLGGMALVGKVRNLRTRSARGTRPSTPAHH